MSADPALELWAAPRRAQLLERALGVTIKVEAVVREDAAPATAGSAVEATLAPIPAPDPSTLAATES